LELIPLEPICRYFWADGTKLEISTDLQNTEREIRKLNESDVKNFRRYLADSQQKYEVAERTFLSHSLNDLPKLIRPKYFRDLFVISSLKTLDTHNQKYFQSPKLQQLFNRFATYNGSSPYQVPATFALIPYVEFGLGAWYVKGGIYEIPKALEELAREVGVEFRFDAEVQKILVENKKAVGVKLKNGEILNSDFVVANSDAIETYRNLLDEKNRPNFSDKRIKKTEPSCSGFVLLLGVNKRFEQLAHHNIFFSDDYQAEFDAIFKDKRPAENPTIYICATSRTDDTQAPKNSENLFILVNAPYTSEQTDWTKESKNYRDLIIQKLEDFGLKDLGKSTQFEKIITPEDLEKKYLANKGSIYGVSSNGIFSAFLRPPNQSRDIANLFFSSGSTHPGGGMPLVLISGKIVSELIEN
jgi:phytoene desaturase